MKYHSPTLERQPEICTPDLWNTRRIKIHSLGNTKMRATGEKRQTLKSKSSGPIRILYQGRLPRGSSSPGVRRRTLTARPSLDSPPSSKSVRSSGSGPEAFKLRLNSHWDFLNNKTRWTRGVKPRWTQGYTSCIWLLKRGTARNASSQTIF